MSEPKELRAFCEGYRHAMSVERDFYSNTLKTTDDWVLWDTYDINFVGQDYTSEELGDDALLAVVYPRGWEGNLPDHLYVFVVKGESK